ncbi:sedoheptulose-1,7-bisphosphatase, chloroplastic [Olea europaea subsp. europaea]|nr:sedoheptulose-1,7-bisphosphatase, chloroplastic [Olea europaea subsp. europaea]
MNNLPLICLPISFYLRPCSTLTTANMLAPKKCPSSKTWEDQPKEDLVLHLIHLTVPALLTQTSLWEPYLECGLRDKLTGITGREQVAAAMGIFGPRTTYVLSLKDNPGTHEFLLLDEGKWLHVKDKTTIGEGKMFSPGNLRATFDNPKCAKLIDYYVREKYTLRYMGGMVPDVNQIIVKEKGIFTNVTSPTAKAKLRLLFEVAPLGFLIEKAGGYSSDGKQSVLDRVVTNLDDRTQVAYGSKNEIIRFEETLYGSSRLKVAEPVGATA